MGYIDEDHLQKLADELGKSAYGQYLVKLTRTKYDFEL